MPPHLPSTEMPREESSELLRVWLLTRGRWMKSRTTTSPRLFALEDCFFPTCRVRVARFYVSCLLLPRPPPPPLLLSSSSCSTAIHAQCALPDLNHDHPRSVCPAGPQPRPSTPSVPCRTSTTTIPAQCSLPDLNHDHPRPVFPAGPQPRVSTPSVPCRTSCRKIWDKECAEES